MTWTADELAHFAAADELEITARRPDGTLRAWTPIWVVVADGQVYVRTWHRRDTGWFGRAVASRRARVRVPGVEVDVRVTDLGPGDADVRARIEAAYLTKYRRYESATVHRMVTDDAAAATLRLGPDEK